MPAGDSLDIDDLLFAFRHQDCPGPQTFRSGAASNSCFDSVAEAWQVTSSGAIPLQEVYRGRDELPRLRQGATRGSGLF